MSDPVMDYLSGIEPAKRAVIEHYYDVVRDLFPDAVPGKKYAMACYTLRGKGLIAIVATKAGLSVIPFSGSLNAQVAGDFEVSEGGGSLYCTVDRPLPDDAFAELVRLRAAQIV